MDRMNDPEVVRREYANEDGLAARRSIYAGAEGVDTNDALVDLLLSGPHAAAVTNAADHLSELSELIGVEGGFVRSFSLENGPEILGRSFRDVAVHDVRGVVTFPDSGAARAYVSSLILYKHLAGNVPEPSEQPLRVSRHNAILVASK